MFGLDLYTVTFEMTQADSNNVLHSERTRKTAPEIMLKTDFLDIMEQAKNIKTPFRIRMYIPYSFYDEIERRNKILFNYIEFCNKAFLDAGLDK